MPTCLPRASEPGWLLGTGRREALAEPEPKLRGSSALLLPSERCPLRSGGDDLTGCLSSSTGNVVYVWLPPPPGTEV